MVFRIYLFAAIATTCMETTFSSESGKAYISQTSRGRKDANNLENVLRRFNRNFEAALEKRFTEHTLLIPFNLEDQRKAFEVRLRNLETKLDDVSTSLTRGFGPILETNLEAKLGAVTRGLDSRLEAVESHLCACVNQAVTAGLENLNTVLAGQLCTPETSVTQVRTAAPDTSSTVPTMLDPTSFVFLRRQDGSVNFSRTWNEYRDGFGDVEGEFWLGLEQIHQITNSGRYRLLVNLTDWSGEHKWAVYNHFRVASESEGYQLSIGDYDYSSTAGNCLDYNNGMKFTTVDHDQDGCRDCSCVEYRKGGWWYDICTKANPTGAYKPAGYIGDAGLSWTCAFDDWRSFKTVILTLQLI